MTTALALAAAPDLWDPNTFEHAQRLAKLFSASALIPEHMRGKIPDVTIALMMAKRLQEDPLIVMQNIFIVSGKAGWSAQYIIARANRSGVFKGRINWRETGADQTLELTAFATLADTGEEVSFPVSMQMARDEGWTKNPKYKSMPKLMLRYRSATFLVRLYAPEVMLGLPTTEEHEDTLPAARIVLDPLGDLGPIPSIESAGTRAGQLAAILDAVEEPAVPPVVAPPPAVVASVAPAAPPVESSTVAPPTPTEEPKPVVEEPKMSPERAAQLARVSHLENELPGKVIRAIRTALNLAPTGSANRLGPASLDAYHKALQSEMDELALMGGAE